jgi:hypothetical protein
MGASSILKMKKRPVKNKYIKEHKTLKKEGQIWNQKHYM